MQQGAGKEAPEEPVRSIFDEDPESLREQRLRELRRVRSVLVSSGILILLPELISRLRNGGLEGLGERGFLVYAMAVLVAYFALGGFALRKPLTALLAGIAVYAALQVWIIWSAPAGMFSGWIFRCLVLLNLCMPLPRARALQQPG